MMAFLLSINAYAQDAGDYRSAANGNWSVAATWEEYDGDSWEPAASAPTGAETTTISDTVSVDVAVTLTGQIIVTDAGVLEVGAGSLEIAAGGTYEHARDGGTLPSATWAEGSTYLLTGTDQDAPGNRNQNFHHVTINTPDLGRNRDLGLNEVTIGGDLRIVTTGANRWQLTSASGGESATVTILGDVFVEDGQFAVQGTGNAMTEFEVHHYGDIIVTGGNFSAARGSQGSGTGTTIWYLYEGNFTMSGAATQNSNPTPGNARYVFAAGGTQQLTFSDVTYAGGEIHFEVADTTTLEITDDFELNGQLVNHGEVVAQGELVVLDGGVYEHARNGGSVPSATWAEGSTALFTGVSNEAPSNRGQDYHHLVLNTPDLSSNLHMSLDGATIGGDIRVVNTGAARWYLTSASTEDSSTVTIMGDVLVEDGQFSVQGTGNNLTTFIVHHYGDVEVTGGNFSIARGSQGGTGTTTWYLHEGDFSMSNAQTQNSNSTPGNARFVFAGTAEQNLVLGENNQIDNLSIEVASTATLNLGMSEIGGNGIFLVQEGGTVSTGHPNGLSGNLQTSGEITLGPGVNVTYSGTEAQVLGTFADTLHTLTIANAEGVSVSDTVSVMVLVVEQDAILSIDSTGSLTTVNGTVQGTIVNAGELIAESALEFGAGAVYEHARNGGTIPTGVWAEGSTVLITGVTDEAPSNRGQDFYHLTLNTPNQSSNLHMSLTDATIGGDIRVIDTGSARWYLTSASAEDTATVTLMGDVIVEGGQFSVQGTGNALTTFIVDHYGDIDVTGGNFSIARGSQGGTGSTTWYLHEGSFSMSGAQTQNSNKDNAKFVFSGDGVQQLTLGEENQIDNLPIEVSSGSTLDMGVSELVGADLFVLNAGATLATAHSGGVAGAIQTSGEVTLDTAANFTFNGAEEQVTSTLMPIIVNDLVIENEAGVTLSQITTINGVLRLLAGEFDNTIPFVLGPEASISYEGGSLRVTTSTEPELEIPTEYALHQNYPNPFNPSTIIRYDIRERADVTVTIYDATGRSVVQLVSDSHAPGKYEVEWNAGGLSSGVYYYQIRAGDWSATRSLLLVK